MRVVSLNAWGGTVWNRLGDWLAVVGADVLCLQEVTRSPKPAPGWLVYRDAERVLDQRADLFDDVSTRLPRHHGHFAAAARGTLEDAQGRGFLSEHGIAAWIAPHLALTGQVQCFVHGRFRPNGWGPAPVPRTMQALRLHDADSGRDIVVAHLHGLRDPDGKADTPARAAQAEAIVATLAALREAGDLVVLAGDLNLLPDSATFARLAEIGLTDLVTTRRHSDTRTSLYTKAQRFADYMLISDPAAVRGFDVPAVPEVSDHRPLILDL